MTESTEIDAKLVAALWQVLAAEGWNGVTMSRVAAASGVPVAEIRSRCPTPWHLLRLHARATDRAVLDGSVPDTGSSPRDRIFDALMRRIDALQPHRAGILRLFEDLRTDPPLALLLLLTLPKSMGWMLEAADISPRGPLGSLRAKGLGAVWLATLRAWTKDESPDLGTTMAALDRALDRAGQVARSFRVPLD